MADSDLRIVPFNRPDIGDAEIQAVNASLQSGWLTTGPRVAEFEERFAALVGAPAALAVNSCTAGLHVALLALGIGPGDTVVTTDMTFCATAHVIDHCGATVRAVDIDPVTMNMDVKALASLAASDPSIRAVIPVHYAGWPCDMDAIFEVSRRHSLAIIEDAAHALGGSYRGVPIGAIQPDLQHAVAFSFYATKNLVTGEGGMLVGSDSFIESARPWVLHGMTRDAWKRYDRQGSWRYDVEVPGQKCNMTDLAAALGLVQLSRFDNMQARRRVLAKYFVDALAGVPEVELMPQMTDPGHALHLFPIRVHSDTLSRDAVIVGLAEAGVSTSVHFQPLHELSYYRDTHGFAAADFPNSSAAFARVLSLPFYSAMSDAEAEHVVTTVRDVLGR